MKWAGISRKRPAISVAAQNAARVFAWRSDRAFAWMHHLLSLPATTGVRRLERALRATIGLQPKSRKVTRRGGAGLFTCARVVLIDRPAEFPVLGSVAVPRVRSGCQGAEMTESSCAARRVNDPAAGATGIRRWESPPGAAASRPRPAQHRASGRDLRTTATARIQPCSVRIRSHLQGLQCRRALAVGLSRFRCGQSRTAIEIRGLSPQPGGSTARGHGASPPRRWSACALHCGSDAISSQHGLPFGWPAAF
jgi:hypothetical protein